MPDALATAPLVAWPDDDCTYPPQACFPWVLSPSTAEPELDVLVGRIGGSFRRVGLLVVPSARARLGFAVALAPCERAGVLADGALSGRLGIGARALAPAGVAIWDAGEDTDWLIRAVGRLPHSVRSQHYRAPPGIPFFTQAPREARGGPALRAVVRAAVALTHGYGLRFVAWLVDPSGRKVRRSRLRNRAAFRAHRSTSRQRSGVSRVLSEFRHRRRRGGATGTRARYIPREFDDVDDPDQAVPDPRLHSGDEPHFVAEAGEER